MLDHSDWEGNQSLKNNNFHQLEVVGRASETQLQVGDKVKRLLMIQVIMLDVVTTNMIKG